MKIKSFYKQKKIKYNMNLVINTCPKNQLWTDEYITPITNIIKANFKIIHHSEINENVVEEYDKIIISGNPLGEIEHLENITNFEWLKTTTKPVLGICAGMQIIGKVFGCKIIENEEIGLNRILTLMPNKLFNKPSFEVYSLHTHTIEPNEEFEILSKTMECVQAIKHKEKEIYAVIFHPEVRTREIIENFINL